jgi:hypothetical protein
VTTNILSRQRLVGDVPECFGDLDSILSLPRGDKMDGMSGVGRGELGRTPTQGLLKRGTMLRAKSGDGTSVKASRR